MVFAKDKAAVNGFNHGTVNGVAFDDRAMAPMFRLQKGRRYRLHMDFGFMALFDYA